MAAVTLLGTATFDTASGTKTVTATPAVGDLIVIVVAHTGSTASVAPTDNNSSGTYTLAGTAVKATSADTMQFWVRTALIPAAASTVFTHAPGATSGGGLAVLKVTGAFRVGAEAVRQFAKQDNQAAATPAPVFGSAVLTGNAVIGAVFNATNPATMTPRGTPAYTERADVGYNTPASGLEVMSIDSGETGTTITWGNASASAFASAAVEIDASVPRLPLDAWDHWAADAEVAPLTVGSHQSDQQLDALPEPAWHDETDLGDEWDGASQPVADDAPVAGPPPGDTWEWDEAADSEPIGSGAQQSDLPVEPALPAPFEWDDDDSDPDEWPAEGPVGADAQPQFVDALDWPADDVDDEPLDDSAPVGADFVAPEPPVLEAVWLDEAADEWDGDAAPVGDDFIAPIASPPDDAWHWFEGDDLAAVVVGGGSQQSDVAAAPESPAADGWADLDDSEDWDLIVEDYSQIVDDPSPDAWPWFDEPADDDWVAPDGPVGEDFVAPPEHPSPLEWSEPDAEDEWSGEAEPVGLDAEPQPVEHDWHWEEVEDRLPDIAEPVVDDVQPPPDAHRDDLFWLEEPTDEWWEPTDPPVGEDAAPPPPPPGGGKARGGMALRERLLQEFADDQERAKTRAALPKVPAPQRAALKQAARQIADTPEVTEESVERVIGEALRGLARPEAKHLDWTLYFLRLEAHRRMEAARRLEQQRLEFERDEEEALLLLMA